MTQAFGWTFLLFGITLVLVTLSVWLRRGWWGRPEETYTTPARLFLVVLRLAIGWHFCIEGLEKLHTPNWSGEPYLRESYGPFADVYRKVAGDRVADRVRARPEGEETNKELPPQFPPALDAEWQAYYDAFVAHYQLDAEKAERARTKLEQAKADTLTWFTDKTEEVEKIAPYPPVLKLPMTMPARLTEYRRLQYRVAELEAQLPSEDASLHTRWKNAKADVSKWRAGLKKSADEQTAKMKAALDVVLKDTQGMTDPAKQEYETWLANHPPLPESVRPPPAAWTVLEWSDLGVTWGLIFLGTGLMLGLLSRTCAALGALLVLSFYLAMPPLPGWPEVPRAEGHYLVINKTLIEVFALAALAFIPTGRWAGLDGLLQLFGRDDRRHTPHAAAVRAGERPQPLA